MAISQRVKRLELIRRCSPCPVCHGQQPYTINWIHEGEPIPPAAGCPGCGDVNQIVVRQVTKPIDYLRERAS